MLYGYKALIQTATIILALKTRKVKVRGLDDYREIVLATYVSSFLLAIIIIFTYTLFDRINTFAALSSFCFLAGTTVTIALVFVPKVNIIMYSYIITCEYHVTHSAQCA